MSVLQSDDNELALALNHLEKRGVCLERQHEMARSHLMVAALLVSQADFRQTMLIDSEQEGRAWIAAIVAWLQHFKGSKLDWSELQTEGGVFLRNSRHGASNGFRIDVKIKEIY
jgi:hypothetical protein